ncbi:MgtC/SapB family protein [Acidaminobacter sp. JC074]|uniref:MgtC/SapB family protein n=1 Tax=Acidaminobacter sp. JC074 TaxID=2530199 RepID=UPI001F10DD44|nr:MgtC/SapB family protein [Acidaminobacter sp. JC074]MCH4888587.1 MgtC/SapB family protein [Acidaminobacter sp. JC074]
MLYREIIVRLLLATLIGGIIGYERTVKNRPAGFRTHILVCVGAALVMVMQEEMMHNLITLLQSGTFDTQAIKLDLGRMAGQVITGVGFLGAGTIIRDKGQVKGLTTAASVWIVACIGLAIGAGMYFITLTAVIIVMFSLFILKKLERHSTKKRRKRLNEKAIS